MTQRSCVPWERIVDDAPVQNNDYDCGVYACMFAMRLWLINQVGDIQPQDVTAYRDTMREWITMGLEDPSGLFVF